MREKTLYLVLILLICSAHSFCQQQGLKFYEIIKGDSVEMFFNTRHNFTEKKCSYYTRFVRLDSAGNFDGYFEDISYDNMLLCRGQYRHGKKYGYFEFYHTNGRLRCKGNYLNNAPVGEWQYYYENSLPERTIDITTTDTLLVRFANKKGKLLIVNGNGRFEGVVAGITNQNDIIAVGEIEDGKPDGKWTSRILNKFGFAQVGKEGYNHGKFVSGTFLVSPAGGSERYRKKPSLNTFFLGSYLVRLENFSTEQCSDSLPDLRARINSVIVNLLAKASFDTYAPGDNYLTIQFTTNKEGNTEGFKLLSSWGQQYFDLITPLIMKEAKFPSGKVMYFHLKLHVQQGLEYQYNFDFSENSSPN